ERLGSRKKGRDYRPEWRVYGQSSRYQQGREPSQNRNSPGGGPNANRSSPTILDRTDAPLSSTKGSWRFFRVSCGCGGRSLCTRAEQRNPARRLRTCRRRRLETQTNPKIPQVISSSVGRSLNISASADRKSTR